MMIQTLVENGIKHGISKMPEGGDITITTSRTDADFKIEIVNSGQLLADKRPDSGFGLENTRNRLELLFGKKATFSIQNFDDQHVISTIIIKT